MRSTTGALAVAAAFVTAGLAALPGAAAAADCPNAAFRTGAAAALPECRAWEQVSPIDKNGNETNPRVPTVSNGGGDRVWYASPSAIVEPGGAPLDIGFSATRGADWTTVGTDAPVSPGFLQIRTTLGVSEDGTKALVVSLARLTADAVGQDGDSYLYVRDLRQPSAYTLVATMPGRGFYDTAPGFNNQGAFVDATSDMGSVLFQTTERVLDDVPTDGNFYLYLWHEGRITLASREPDGTPLATQRYSRTPDRSDNALSTDGTVATWLSADGRQFRSTPGAPSVQVNASRTDNPPNSAVVPPIATPDGRYSFFTNQSALTDESAPPGGTLPGAVYRYDAATGELTDLTAAVTPAGAGAEMRFALAAVSPDGAVAWIYAGRALTPDDARESDLRLYALDVATRTPRLVGAFGDGPSGFSNVAEELRLSPDGRRIAVRTRGPLDGTDNRNPACGLGSETGFCSLIYTWDSAAPESAPVCVSCAAGAPVGGDAFFGDFSSQTPFSGAVSRGLTDDGRVFFDATQALVPGDGNRSFDVYQYTPGAGLALLSLGQGGLRARFGDASEDGSTVFIHTAQRLVPQDGDDLADVYAVRVGGGIAAQQVAPPSTSDRCSGDACRAPLGPLPARPVQGTATFVAPQLAAAPSFALVRPSAARLRRDARRGRVVVPVRVSQAGEVTVRLRARLGGKSLRPIGRATRRAQGPMTLRVSVRLTRAARTFLRRNGRLSPRTIIDYSPRARPRITTLRITTGRTGSDRGGAR